MGRKQASVGDDAAKRARIKAKRPVIGRLASLVTPRPVITPESQSTKAWAIGAVGEQRVGEALRSCEGVHVLHDRLMPHSRANIDHIAVAPSGVYVIDAKRYEGNVEARDVGDWRSQDVRLYVNGRDRTKLIDAMAAQVEAVRNAIPAGSVVPIHPVLCFVDGTWPMFRRRPLSIRGVTIIWPDGLANLVTTEVEAPLHAPRVIAQQIAATLGAAWRCAEPPTTFPGPRHGCRRHIDGSGSPTASPTCAPPSQSDRSPEPPTRPSGHRDGTRRRSPP